MIFMFMFNNTREGSNDDDKRMPPGGDTGSENENDKGGKGSGNR